MTDKEQINKCECTCDECGAECEPFWKKENKEQIIVNGVDIFDVIDKWASLTSNEWCCDEAESEEEYLKAESIKNYILDINKQLACKTQECVKLNCEIIDMNSIIEDAAINLGNKDFTLYDLPFEIKKLRKECKDLREDYEELEQRHNGAFQDFELLKQKYRELEIKNVTLQNRYQQVAGATTEAGRYRKALGEIEEIVNVPCVADALDDCKSCDMWCEHKDILNIINKAKGEELL